MVREIKAMPEPEEGTLYVVPGEVVMILQEEHADVVFPAEERQVRDSDGQLRRATHLRRVMRSMRGEDSRGEERAIETHDLRWKTAQRIENYIQTAPTAPVALI